MPVHKAIGWKRCTLMAFVLIWPLHLQEVVMAR